MCISDTASRKHGLYNIILKQILVRIQFAQMEDNILWVAILALALVMVRVDDCLNYHLLYFVFHHHHSKRRRI